LNSVNADVIDIEALRTANVIGHNVKSVKIFLSGEINKAVTVKGIAVSKGAKAAIEAAGGKIED
jgi:large subunit ribosomal protein L15